ncbi:hypothetical protein LZ30DRAFT_178086 [Colletotrichum cereale]|nr:hypothetical protein LZ30DRAFT_178086 [Colletotrichum cereale]
MRGCASFLVCDNDPRLLLLLLLLLLKIRQVSEYWVVCGTIDEDGGGWNLTCWEAPEVAPRTWTHDGSWLPPCPDKTGVGQGNGMVAGRVKPLHCLHRGGTVSVV